MFFLYKLNALMSNRIIHLIQTLGPEDLLNKTLYQIREHNASWGNNVLLNNQAHQI